MRLPRLFVALVVLLAFCSLICLHKSQGKVEPPNQIRETHGQTSPMVMPSPLLKEVRKKLKEQPSISTEQLAAYANSLLADRGFNYKFELCIESKERTCSCPDGIYPLQLELLPNRQPMIFRINEPWAQDPCSYCFYDLPSLKVTQDEVVLVAAGKSYRVRRTKDLVLDEMYLVDGTMHKTLRTWQVPYHSVPLGLSGDGRKLYLEVSYSFDDLDNLVLELSEDGRLRFVPRSQMPTQHGEWLKKHPQDAHNDYLSFKRFRIGNKTYIVRFSAPCT